MPVSKDFKRNLSVAIGAFILLTNTGCTPLKIQERIEETDKLNQSIEKDIKIEDIKPEDVEVSDEQKKVLEEMSGSVESALEENKLEEREEVEIDIPKQKTNYDNPEELSQYVSDLFFLYHTMKIDGFQFYKKIEPVFHDKFRELLPASEVDQIETFELLQHKFNENITSPIESYNITNTKIEIRGEEASVYRVYELKNKERLYFTTLMEKVGDYWYMTEDSPSPSYHIIDKSLKKP